MTKKARHRLPSRHAVGINELKMIAECILYYRVRGLDPGYDGIYEERYTDLFVEYMGSHGFADAVSSGCAAIYVAIKSLSLTPGSVIATSPVTDASVIGCITEQGHIPYLLDSDQLSYNISVQSLTDRYDSSIRALVVTHAGGEPCEMDPIVDFCKSKDILIIEDCSQAIGAIPKCSSKRVGSYGRFACYSTMYRKNLSASGSSGLIYSQDYGDYRLAKQFADRGKKWWDKELVDMRDPGFADFPGLNWNSDELRCAIGLSNLKRLEQTNERRRSFVGRLIEEFRLQNIQMFSPYNFHEGFAPFYFPVFVNTENSKKSVVEISEELRDLGIGVGVKYGCLVSTWNWAKPFMYDSFSAPNALATRDSCFHLYLNENYGEREVNFIVSTLKHYECGY